MGRQDPFVVVGWCGAHHVACSCGAQRGSASRPNGFVQNLELESGDLLLSCSEYFRDCDRRFHLLEKGRVDPLHLLAPSKEGFWCGTHGLHLEAVAHQVAHSGASLDVSIGCLNVDASIPLPLEEEVVVGVFLQCRVPVDGLLTGGGSGDQNGFLPPFVSEEHVFPVKRLLAFIPCLEPDRVNPSPKRGENAQWAQFTIQLGDVGALAAVCDEKGLLCRNDLRQGA